MNHVSDIAFTLVNLEVDQSKSFVQANLFQVVQPAASLSRFETHLCKKVCLRLVAVKFLLYLALSEFYLYQSTTITQAGLVHPVRFN